jgi:hypothetical protein
VLGIDSVAILPLELETQDRKCVCLGTKVIRILGTDLNAGASEISLKFVKEKYEKRSECYLGWKGDAVSKTTPLPHVRTPPSGRQSKYTEFRKDTIPRLTFSAFLSSSFTMP